MNGGDIDDVVDTRNNDTKTNCAGLTLLQPKNTNMQTKRIY